MTPRSAGFDAGYRAGYQAAKDETHTIAWQSSRSILCSCGEVCNAVIKRSPAPLLGSTSDDYVARAAADVFGEHLRAVRTITTVITPGQEPTS